MICHDVYQHAGLHDCMVTINSSHTVYDMMYIMIHVHIVKSYAEKYELLTCWIVLKIIKDVLKSWTVSWVLLNPSRWNEDWNKTCCLSFTANIMPADALASLGASASAAVVLIPQTWNILSPASEEMRHLYLLLIWAHLDLIYILIFISTRVNACIL